MDLDQELVFDWWPYSLELLQLMPLTLIFCVGSVTMFWIVCLKAWSTEIACKKCLICMHFNGDCLFGILQECHWRKGTPTPQAKAQVSFSYGTMHKPQNQGVTLPFDASFDLLNPQSLPRSPPYNRPCSGGTSVGVCASMDLRCLRPLGPICH